METNVNTVYHWRQIHVDSKVKIGTQRSVVQVGCVGHVCAMNFLGQPILPGCKPMSVA